MMKMRKRKINPKFVWHQWPGKYIFGKILLKIEYGASRSIGSQGISFPFGYWRKK